MKKKGRPTKYNETIAKEICEAVESGLSLNQLCKRTDMPARASVHKWLAENKDFSDKYAKSKEIYADGEFDRMFELADNVFEDANSIAKARLQIDTRKWALSKLLPKKYGDKIQQEVSGPDGGNLVIQWQKPE